MAVIFVMIYLDDRSFEKNYNYDRFASQEKLWNDAHGPNIKNLLFCAFLKKVIFFVYQRSTTV